MRFKQFIEWRDEEEEDPWTTSEIEDEARAMNQRMGDYGIEDFDDEAEDDYITPDDIWTGQNRHHRVGHCVFTFTFSKRRVMPAGQSGGDWAPQGLQIVPCIWTHSQIERNLRVHPEDTGQNVVLGRYGSAWSKPVITIWQGNGDLLHECLKEMVRRNLAHPLARVYVNGENQGTLENLIDYNKFLPKKEIKQQPEIPVQIGNQTIDLNRVPALLHSTPKASPLFAALQDFICKNKDNPRYVHILKHVANRVNCYRQTPNFANYQRLRGMLSPVQIDTNFRTQRERDRAFDLMMQNAG